MHGSTSLRALPGKRDFPNKLFATNRKSPEPEMSRASAAFEKAKKKGPLE
jgi:hypothetical protein